MRIRAVAAPGHALRNITNDRAESKVEAWGAKNLMLEIGFVVVFYPSMLLNPRAYFATSSTAAKPRHPPKTNAPGTPKKVAAVPI